MQQGKYLILNGKNILSGETVISADNRSFRYGDGFFETMKMIDGKIILGDLHFERLFSSLQILQFEIPKYFAKEKLEEEVTGIAEKNKHGKLGRIRLTIFRGDGGLYDAVDNHPNYIIQSWEMNPVNNEFNINGLVTDIFPYARKACDSFSHIKSNNYLPYVMGALWARNHKLNDAFVLNMHNRIADATIANIFIVKNGMIQTPSLDEGCVSGIIRRFLIEKFGGENICIAETAITSEDLQEADEIFLTNAGYGMRWVANCGNKKYINKVSQEIFQSIVAPLYPISSF